MTETPEKAVFLRGDVVGDGRVDLSDAINVLSYLFLARASPDASWPPMPTMMGQSTFPTP